MNRTEFLKRLGIGAAAVVVVPNVLVQMPIAEPAMGSDNDPGILMDEHLQDLKAYKDRVQSANHKLMAFFEAEPQLSMIVSDCINGSTFREAIENHLSLEDFTSTEEIPDYEEWNKIKTARFLNSNK